MVAAGELAPDAEAVEVRPEASLHGHAREVLGEMWATPSAGMSDSLSPSLVFIIVYRHRRAPAFRARGITDRISGGDTTAD